MQGFALRWHIEVPQYDGMFFSAFQKSILVRFHYVGEVGLFENKITVPLSSYYINCYNLNNGTSTATFPNQAVWNNLNSASAIDSTIGISPDYLTIGGEAINNGGNVSVTANQAAIDIDIAGILHDQGMDVSRGITGLTLKLQVDAEWPASAPPYQDSDIQQLCYYLYEGNWDPATGPTWNNVTVDAPIQLDQGDGYSSIQNKTGPYPLFTQAYDIYNTGNNSYNIHINGELLETLVFKVEQAIANNVPAYIKLVIKDRRMATFSQPRDLQSEVGSFTSSVDINASEVTIYTNQNRPDNVKASKVLEIPTRILNASPPDGEVNKFGLGDSVFDYPGTMTNYLVNDPPRDISYGHLFLGDSSEHGARDGSVSFEGFPAEQSPDAFEGQMYIGNSGIWANGDGCMDHGDTENSYTVPTSWQHDGYPYRRAWTFGIQRTYSSGTGPHGNDYVGGNGNNGYAGEGWDRDKFAYTEATSRHHSVFRLHTPNINIRNAVRGSLFLEFWAHMLAQYTNRCGRLQVNVAEVGGVAIAGNQSGNTFLDWKEAPLEVYWDEYAGQTGTPVRRSSLGAESLDGQDMNFYAVGVTPIENHAEDAPGWNLGPDDFGGRLQTSFSTSNNDYTDDSNWCRVRVNLNHLIADDLDVDKIIRIEFKAYTRPRTGNAQSTNTSGYCADYGGPGDWEYHAQHSPEAYFPPHGSQTNYNTNVKYQCENDGFTWVAVSSNRAGLGTTLYYQSDIAIDGVKVIGDRFAASGEEDEQDEN